MHKTGISLSHLSHPCCRATTKQSFSQLLQPQCSAAASFPCWETKIYTGNRSQVIANGVQSFSKVGAQRLECGTRKTLSPHIKHQETPTPSQSSAAPSTILCSLQHVLKRMKKQQQPWVIPGLITSFTSKNYSQGPKSKIHRSGKAPS